MVPSRRYGIVVFLPLRFLYCKCLVVPQDLEICRQHSLGPCSKFRQHVSVSQGEWETYGQCGLGERLGSSVDPLPNTLAVSTLYQDAASGNREVCRRKRVVGGRRARVMRKWSPAWGRNPTPSSAATRSQPRIGDNSGSAYRLESWRGGPFVWECRVRREGTAVSARLLPRGPSPIACGGRSRATGDWRPRMAARKATSVPKVQNRAR
ncbi:hypothetical protein B0T16DRAFT_400274 [Cercophora newfieldiana]|uniref:Secreted protein n=1 Tax=Cercophora newfieldiana TaxID=92897 RepID=A0AA40CZ06_9PEZI|nr:hypothetical protein B0T16DRAFT_400274 [Cercophora newfieldiana]